MLAAPDALPVDLYSPYSNDSEVVYPVKHENFTQTFSIGTCG
jgi:hypothetical protein